MQQNVTNFACCLNALCVAQLRRNLTGIAQTGSVVKTRDCLCDSCYTEHSWLPVYIKEFTQKSQQLAAGSVLVNLQPVSYDQHLFLQWVLQRIFNSTLCSLLAEKKRLSTFEYASVFMTPSLKAVLFILYTSEKHQEKINESRSMS